MSRRAPWLPVIALALAAGGCLTQLAADGAADGNEASACVVDADCSLAGPSCCACPTYALPMGAEFASACDGVVCPMPTGCTPLVARCDEGACVAECAPATCDLVCPGGFVADASGCLSCACAPPPAAAECALDTDCVRVAADCCGCDRGGADTAVPTVRLADFQAGLMCAGDEACPGVSTCTGDEARCQLGRCALVAPTGQPGPLAGACGRPELPPCPAGQVCQINQDDDANPLGVGVCQPSP